MDEVGDHIVALVRALQAVKVAAIREGAINREFAAHQLLLTLARTGPARVSELAAALVLDPSTASRHVHQLKSEGLIRSERDPDDARASRLALTEAGLAAYDRLRDERNAFFRKVLDEWTPDEVAVLVSNLDRLSTSIDAYRGELFPPDQITTADRHNTKEPHE